MLGRRVGGGRWVAAAAAVALVAVGAVACVPPYVGGVSRYVVRPGQLEPEATEVSPQERVATWNRAVLALLAEGYVPQVVNEAAGYVSGKRRDDLVADNLAGSTAIVCITPEGHVLIEVSGGGLYSAQEQLVADVRAEQRRLMDRLLGKERPAAATSPAPGS